MRKAALFFFAVIFTDLTVALSNNGASSVLTPLGSFFSVGAKINITGGSGCITGEATMASIIGGTLVIFNRALGSRGNVCSGYFEGTGVVIP